MVDDAFIHYKQDILFSNLVMERMQKILRRKNKVADNKEGERNRRIVIMIGSFTFLGIVLGFLLGVYIFEVQEEISPDINIADFFDKIEVIGDVNIYLNETALVDYAYQKAAENFKTSSNNVWVEFESPRYESVANVTNGGENNGD